MARNRKAKAVKRKDLAKPGESIAKMEASLSPEAKKLLKEIDEIRKSIGPVPFKIMDIIREIRE